jgi:hypothetical protein
VQNIATGDPSVRAAKVRRRSTLATGARCALRRTFAAVLPRHLGPIKAIRGAEDAVGRRWQQMGGWLDAAVPAYYTSAVSRNRISGRARRARTIEDQGYCHVATL